MCPPIESAKELRQAAVGLAAACVQNLLGVDMTPVLPETVEDFDALLAKLDEFDASSSGCNS